MKPFSLVAAAALAALALPAQAADPAPVVAAERAFAERVAEVGVRDGFLAFMADEAIVFAKGPVNAKAFYAAQPAGTAPKDGGARLAWWPRLAGLAKSGDLGFTTGPAELNGRRFAHYFTVWRRQPDGGWKWVYDGGVEADAAAELGPEAPVAAVAEGLAGDPATAFAEVQAAEARLADAAPGDGDGFRAMLAAGAVVRRAAGDAQPTRFSPLGGGVSAAGDLAWTYGAAELAGAAKHYVRIWRRDAAGWRIIYDQVL